MKEKKWRVSYILHEYVHVIVKAPEDATEEDIAEIAEEQLELGNYSNDDFSSDIGDIEGLPND